MYTCIATLKTSNGEYYKTGEEISDFKYRNLRRMSEIVSD